MPPCSLGGYLSVGDTIHFVYDNSDNPGAVTVCSGWLRMSSPLADPNVDVDSAALPPGVECEPVAPFRSYRSKKTVATTKGDIYIIRVDHSDASGRGTLTVYINDVEIASESLDGCGVAIWTFDVIS